MSWKLKHLQEGFWIFDLHHIWFRCPSNTSRMARCAVAFFSGPVFPFLWPIVDCPRWTLVFSFRITKYIMLLKSQCFLPNDLTIEWQYFLPHVSMDRIELRSSSSFTWKWEMKQTEVAYGKNFVDLPLRMLPSAQLTANPLITISVNFNSKNYHEQQDHSMLTIRPFQQDWLIDTANFHSPQT